LFYSCVKHVSTNRKSSLRRVFRMIVFENDKIGL